MYVQKTLGTKTILSRGETGKSYCATFSISNTGKKKKKKMETTEFKPGLATGSQ